MSGILSLGFILIPLLAGITLLALGSHVSRAMATRTALVVTALATLCGLGLTGYIDRDIPFTLTWIPGTGTMTLPIGGTGLYATLVTTTGAFLALLAAYIQGNLARSPVTGLGIVTLAAANIAFLSGHFLSRYVALEVVGVCIALVPLLALRNEEGGLRLAKFVYLVLRIGDAGFLTAILILMQAGGTLDIAAALEAGTTIDGGRLGWVVAGFLLAVWVKVGIWPFHGWLQAGQHLTRASHAWTYATVMPNLGLYLLYRITPLLILHPILQLWALWMGVAGTFMASVLAVRRFDLRDARPYIDAALGGLALCTAASGLKPVVWLLLIIWTPLRLMLFQWHAPGIHARRWSAGMNGISGVLLTLLNAVLVWWIAHHTTPAPVLLGTLIVSVLLIGYACLQKPLHDLRAASSGQSPWLRAAPWILASALAFALGISFRPALQSLTLVVRADFPPVPALLTLARYWLINPLVWLGSALLIIVKRRYWTETKPGIKATTQTHDIERGILTVARRVNAVIEMQFLERVVEWVPRGIAGGATFLHHVVEEGGLEGLLRNVVRGAMATGRGLQQWHTGRLRANLGWAAAILLLAVLAVVTWGW